MTFLIRSHTLFFCTAVTLALLSSRIAVAEDVAPKSTTSAVHTPKPVADVEGEFADFTQWKGVSEFINRMVSEHGFERVELEKLFRRTRYVESAIRLIKPAPANKPKNWRAYRARFVDPTPDQCRRTLLE